MSDISIGKIMNDIKELLITCKTGRLSKENEIRLLILAKQYETARKEGLKAPNPHLGNTSGYPTWLEFAIDQSSTIDQNLVFLNLLLTEVSFDTNELVNALGYAADFGKTECVDAIAKSYHNTVELHLASESPVEKNVMEKTVSEVIAYARGLAEQERAILLASSKVFSAEANLGSFYYYEASAKKEAAKEKLEEVNQVHSQLVQGRKFKKLFS